MTKTSFYSFAGFLCFLGVLTLIGACRVTPTPPALSPVDQVIGRSAQIEALVAQTDLTLLTSARTAEEGGVIPQADFLRVQSYAQQIARANDTAIKATQAAIGSGGVGSIPSALIAESAVISQNPKIDNPGVGGIIQTLLGLAQQIQDLQLAPPAAPAH